MDQRENIFTRLEHKMHVWQELIFTILFSLLFASCLLQTVAFAAPRVFSVGHWDVFEHALAQAQDGDTIELTANISKRGNWENVVIGKAIILDGNGFEITVGGKDFVFQADATLKNLNIKAQKDGNRPVKFYISDYHVKFENITTKISDLQENERPTIVMGKKTGFGGGAGAVLEVSGAAEANKTVFNAVYVGNDGSEKTTNSKIITDQYVEVLQQDLLSSAGKIITGLQFSGVNGEAIQGEVRVETSNETFLIIRSAEKAAGSFVNNRKPFLAEVKVGQQTVKIILSGTETVGDEFSVVFEDGSGFKQHQVDAVDIGRGFIEINMDAVPDGTKDIQLSYFPEGVLALSAKITPQASTTSTGTSTSAGISTGASTGNAGTATGGVSVPTSGSTAGGSASAGASTGSAGTTTGGVSVPTSGGTAGESASVGASTGSAGTTTGGVSVPTSGSTAGGSASVGASTGSAGTTTGGVSVPTSGSTAGGSTSAGVSTGTATGGVSAPTSGSTVSTGSTGASSTGGISSTGARSSSSGSSSKGGSGGGSSSGGGGGSRRAATTTKSEAANATGSWKRDHRGWWYQNSDGSYAKNEWKQISYNGKPVWYAFDESGYIRTGWFLSAGHWYYLNPRDESSIGLMQTGWQEIDGRWYYLESVGNAAHPLGAMYANEKTPDAVDASGAWMK